MAKRLDSVVTAVTFTQVAAALETAWSKLLGVSPKPEALAVLLAQSALETGHWKQSYCFNLGNAKASEAWTGDYCFYPADEIVSAEHAVVAYAQRGPRSDGVAGHNVELKHLQSGKVQVTLFGDHPWCRFRAFSNLNDGTADYLQLLHTRFARAWPAIEAGDPARFVRALHELRYFTTSVERYLPPVVKLFERFLPLLKAPNASPAAAEAASAPVLALPISAEGRPSLKRGARGDAVEQIQRILLAMGYEGLTANGVFDESTAQVVELFQLQHVDQRGVALVSDGQVGKRTWWALLNPSGDAQKTHLPSPPIAELTPARAKLLGILEQEHAKPVFEVPDGSNRSRDIDRYFGRTGLRGKPWCCAFVSWSLAQALDRLPIGGKHHLGVQVMWVGAREQGLEVTDPKPGDIFVQLKSKGTGHTGFVVGLSQDGQTVYTCEGNCGNRVKYGQRQRDSIHHFIDAIADEQGADFPRGSNLTFDVVDDDATR